MDTNAAAYPKAARRDTSAIATGNAVGMGNAATVGGTSTSGTPQPWETQPLRRPLPRDPSLLQVQLTPTSQAATDQGSALDIEADTATEGTCTLTTTVGVDITAMTCSQPPPMTEN